MNDKINGVQRENYFDVDYLLGHSAPSPMSSGSGEVSLGDYTGSLNDKTNSWAEQEEYAIESYISGYWWREASMGNEKVTWNTGEPIYKTRLVKLENNNAQSKEGNSNLYYNAIDGIKFNNGEVLSRSQFSLTFNSENNANARYLGYKNGRHHINFDIGDYEATNENIRALTIHEAYGHGVMKYGISTNTHHKAYFLSIDSEYWSKTTLRFKQHTVDQMWKYYSRETGKLSLPSKYSKEFWKYQTLYK